MASHQSRFVALLRGINVGGKNVIAKDHLRQCFEELGFTKVRTYIQSGNILFRSDETSIGELTTAIEAELSQRFSYAAQAVILDYAKYKSAIEVAPDGWGKNPNQKHHAVFTLNGMTPKKALAELPSPKVSIESVTIGPGVIFWSASKKQLAKTTMMKLAATDVYQQVTVRNHNTVLKLLQLFQTI